MDTLSLYDASVPVLGRMLVNMTRWLDKAAEHAQAKGFDPGVYLTLRLAPDMLPFTKQIQIASDNAKGCVARLAGIDVPSFEDQEASLDQLKARLERTRQFVTSVPAERFEGAATREIVLPMRNREPLRFDGRAYLTGFALPNFYFHATTTYALLRHAGVPLGKGDFLGG
ncbi:DUF1993 family protein [Aquabacterium sp. J223]|uniref:DUF1993 domain-containing protein n=1 Tax=Aquabacterium sp. J223 TaxID=2898431 RepID=UPI0021ADBAE3|nr:DUF1993 domain-containing protein [Aquabacterium sp. J223]UUX97594.1 DUF1993 domain-containing protein [Aquabacterium sp. J223]